MSANSKEANVGAFVSVIAITVGLFHLLVVAGAFSLSTMQIRVIHLMLMMVIVFMSHVSRKPNNRLSFPISLVAAIASAAVGIYFLSRWQAIASSGGDTTSLDLYAGLLLLVLVLEITRRRIGATLALITSVFLAYPFISPYLPGVFHGRGVSVNRVANFLTTTTEGVYGIPLGVAATYIIMFSLFGAFLNQFGAGDFFFRMARRVTKGMLAASAKTAVLFSTLLGMISGSAAGNVAVTGSFTIPMMTKEGYKPRQAAAIEAVVSTGGQILPPVMGSAAFIMAEIVGTPYTNIMQAALIPALLFFASILFVVHLQAKKNHIATGEFDSNEPDEPLLKALWDGIPFMLPFALLITLMIKGYSPFKACFFALLALVAAYALWNREFGVSLLKRVAVAIRAGTISAAPISIACAAAGIISGSLAVSGLGIKVSSVIIAASGGIAIIALLLTMLTAIALGMGLPTTAAYLILATVVAPSLTELGVPLLTAHMFVFFFGCVSTITPPVALASYVAAGIANADINKVGWTAFSYGITCYLLPFMFFLGPALLFDGTFAEVLLVAVSGFVGVYFIAAAVVAYVESSLTIMMRAASFAAGVMLLLQGWQTDIIGLLVGASVITLSKKAGRMKGSHG